MSAESWWDLLGFLAWFLVGPMLIVLFSRLRSRGTARRVAKTLALLFGSILALALGSLALFASRLKGGHPSDEVVIFLFAVIAGAGLLGSLISLLMVSIPGKEFSPPAGG